MTKVCPFILKNVIKPLHAFPETSHFVDIMKGDEMPGRYGSFAQR